MTNLALLPNDKLIILPNERDTICLIGSAINQHTGWPINQVLNWVKDTMGVWFNNKLNYWGPIDW